MRECRAKQLQEAKNKILKQQTAPLAGAWNKERLREGDKVPMDDEQGWLHGNQWSTSAVISSAWKQLGQVRTLRTGVDGLHREQSVVISLASVADITQSSWMTKEIEAMKVREAPAVFFRSYDATRRDLYFGKLQSELQVLARYPWRDKDTAKWIMLSFDEWC